MTSVLSIDARSGQTQELDAIESTPPQVAALTAAAVGAMPWLRARGRAGRAALLDRIAEELSSHAEAIVAAADRETALGTTRLTGELTRTAYQLRFLGEVARDGGYLDIVIDRATPDTPMGPRPDLRRMLTPLGPVAVFGASNFPLAFGVAGGDTASALAVGCPVVAKAHPAHPQTSLLIAEAIGRAVRAQGGPEGVFGLVFGYEAGITLVKDPRIAAVGFTGSLPGGRALSGIAAARPRPIPFYGELGSLNPLVVTPAAADERAAELGEGIAGSVLLGQGQFCTKPGLILVPATASGAAVSAALADAVRRSAPGHLLTSQIAAAFTTSTDAVTEDPAVRVLARSDGDAAPGRTGALLVSVPSARLLDGDPGGLATEHFGPFAVVAQYADADELAAVLAALEPALTGTVLAATGGADPALASVMELLSGRSGRVIVNGFPTGVAVSWAMQHGGPYPAATTSETSVGATAVRRWLRPVTYQNAPHDVLPAELRDPAVPGLPRRIDGVLTIGQPVA
jgi:NADP-dependent aldehyde dehydrogenase